MTDYVCAPRAAPADIHPGRREGDGLLVVGTMDLEAAILWIHLVSQVPQELLVLGEHFGGAADGECESGRRHVRRRAELVASAMAISGMGAGVARA